MTLTVSAEKKVKRSTRRPTPRSEEDAFLQAIADDPHDDVPRLQYADWLQERGDPRGEFILVQCELARMHPADWRRPDLLRRETELLAAHRAAWAGPVHAVAAAVHFERGFVEKVTLTARRFLDHGKTLTAGPVPVRHVHLTGCGSLLAELADCRHLTALEVLDLSGNAVGDAGCHLLAGSPHLARLTTLKFGANYLGPWGVAALLESALLPRLTGLDLTENRSCVYRGSPLLTSPGLGRLRMLNLGFGGLGNVGAQLLADCPHLARLTHLGLSNCLIGDAGVEALARSPYLLNLVELDLSANFVEARGVRTLAAAPQLTSLRRLLLRNNAIGDDGVRAVLAAPFLKGLTFLSVGSSSISTAAVRQLRERFGNQFRFEI